MIRGEVAGVVRGCAADAGIGTVRWRHGHIAHREASDG